MSRPQRIQHVLARCVFAAFFAVPADNLSSAWPHSQLWAVIVHTPGGPLGRLWSTWRHAVCGSCSCGRSHQGDDCTGLRVCDWPTAPGGSIQSASKSRMVGVGVLLATPLFFEQPTTGNGRGTARAWAPTAPPTPHPPWRPGAGSAVRPLRTYDIEETQFINTRIRRRQA
jgi:hypothetical protein